MLNIEVFDLEKSHNNSGLWQAEVPLSKHLWSSMNDLWNSMNVI